MSYALYAKDSLQLQDPRAIQTLAKWAWFRIPPCTTTSGPNKSPIAINRFRRAHNAIPVRYTDYLKQYSELSDNERFYHGGHAIMGAKAVDRDVGVESAETFKIAREFLAAVVEHDEDIYLFY